ncbi:MAG: aminoacetone oxidase family FAD-binding enzyme [Bacilli bacterium]|nr:aminoacetone oxidase family FAD-binding enzyme [Bacilli bacterium]
MKTLIIGGGASGLIAAIYASTNSDVTILEKNKTLGKKILITGNGKCNYWNSNQDISNYYSSDIDILKDILDEDSKIEINNLFDKIGLVAKIKNGYYYPYSNQATTVQTALIKEIENRGVNVEYETIVTDISFDNEFIVKTNKGDFKADKVIVSTGSYACSKTGSDGYGYEVAKKFGHTIIKPVPSLVQLKAKGNFFKDWAGVRSDVELTYNNKTEVGEIQLTDYGVSGVCVYNLSSMISRDLQESNPILKINFLPFIKSPIDFINYMNDRNNVVINRNVSELLDGLLNYKLVNLLLKLSGIERTDKWSDISNSKKTILADNLINFNLEIIDTTGFDRAQTCSGGIDLKEINPSTMESLKQKGLFFTGEILDADGKCGGYNLEFAFITGYKAGRTND